MKLVSKLAGVAAIGTVLAASSGLALSQAHAAGPELNPSEVVGGVFTGVAGGASFIAPASGNAKELPASAGTHFFPGSAGTFFLPGVTAAGAVGGVTMDPPGGTSMPGHFSSDGAPNTDGGAPLKPTKLKGVAKHCGVGFVKVKKKAIWNSAMGPARRVITKTGTLTLAKKNKNKWCAFVKPMNQKSKTSVKVEVNGAIETAHPATGAYNSSWDVPSVSKKNGKGVTVVKVKRSSEQSIKVTGRVGVKSAFNNSVAKIKL